MEGEGEGDFDGLGELDGGGDAWGVGENVGEYDDDSDGWTGDGPWVTGWLTAGDGLAWADARPFAEAGAAVGRLERVPAVGSGAWACAAWEPAKMSSVTLTAATTHTATAVVAIAAPGLARMLSQLTRLIACENSASHVDSARRTTRRR